jgi:hypothetical protein
VAYSSELGRWVQHDPTGYVDGMNLYLGYSGSPVTLQDSHGLESHVFGAGPGSNASVYPWGQLNPDWPLRRPTTQPNADRDALIELLDLYRKARAWNAQSPPWKPGNECQAQAANLAAYLISQNPKYWSPGTDGGSRPTGFGPYVYHHVVVVKPNANAGNTGGPMVIDPYKGPGSNTIDVSLLKPDEFRKDYPYTCRSLTKTCCGGKHIIPVTPEPPKVIYPLTVRTW